MSHRLCRLNEGSVTINLSPQDMIDCDKINDKCEKGTAFQAFEYARRKGIYIYIYIYSVCIYIYIYSVYIYIYI